MSDSSRGRAAAPISIWRFNVAHELVAGAIAAAALAGGSWFTLDQLERRYLQLHQNDAERVGLMLQEHLLEARQQLERFAALPPQRQRETTELLLPAFSDLYRLNPQHQVVAVLKAQRGSRVFPGFSFAGSHIDAYLRQPPRAGAASSVIDRGLEDERASVYFVGTDAAGGRLLARLNLSYLQDFLSRYNQASGYPVLLVSRHGFVMLASDPLLQVPAVDLNLASGRAATTRSLYQNNQRWLPLVANNSGLGGHIVTLIPADRLEAQRHLVWWSTVGVSSLALLVLLWKNRRLHERLFNPVARFSDQIERLRSQMAKAELTELGGGVASSRFREIAQIERSFDTLLQTIRERDEALQHKLRTSLTAAAIAHEINLPLSTIRMRCLQADQELRHGPPSSEGIQELVQALQADSQQVSRVIEKMRMLLRNVQTDLVPIELASVVTTTLKLLKRPLREQAVQLRCEGLDAAGPLVVLGDAVQLQMALGNLLRNAIEAVADQPAERREVRVILRRDGDQVLLGVADSGPGFCGDPEADTLMRSSKPGGSGLGLFVVRTTMGNHHGRLRIGRSADLGGAELWMELPLASGPSPSASSQDYLKTAMGKAEQDS